VEWRACWYTSFMVIITNAVPFLMGTLNGACVCQPPTHDKAVASSLVALLIAWA
jgi:hypothetical protein